MKLIDFFAKLNKKLLLCIALNLLSLIIFAVCAFSYQDMANSLQHEHMAQVWAGESGERYAQLSAYLPVGGGTTVEAIESFRSKIDEKMLEVSLEAEEGKSLFVDAYSAETNFTVRNGERSADVRAIGVGGDYFFFHSLLLRSGSYLTSWDLMQDRIVLDENTAWLLFGSFDVAGMEVWINEQPYLVAGVVSRDKTHSTQLAEEDTPSVVYVDYSVIADTEPISCYQVIMPDPISGFAASILEESFPLGEHGSFAENSRRFQIKSIAELSFSYAKRIMLNDGIAYPSWENAARYTEVKMGWLLWAAAIALILPLVSLVLVVVYYSRKLSRFVHQKIEERRISA